MKQKAEEDQVAPRSAIRQLSSGTLMLFFTDRDLRLIENCKVYAAADPAGLPGHNLMLIVDKLDEIVGKLIEGRIPLPPKP